MRRSISTLRDKNLVIFQAWRESRRQMTLVRETLVSRESHKADKALSPRRVGPASKRLISVRVSLSFKALRMISTPSEEILFLDKLKFLRVLFLRSMFANPSASFDAMEQ